MKTIYQTTNQQPWVEALAAGLITAKTRIAEPHVPVGATVFLHASKSRLWKDWPGLEWTKDMDMKKLDRGTIVAVATVEAVGPSDQILTKAEKKFWDVRYPYGAGTTLGYNSVAPWTVRFTNIQRLKTPVAVKGMLAPFARAKEDTIKMVLDANPELKSRLA